MLLKVDLISEIKLGLGLNANDALVVFDTIEALLKDAILNKNGVKLFGLGAFNIKEVPIRTRRNPRTGETITLPASRKLVFKPSRELIKELKQSTNQ